jgi:FAD/FMN-containing dehydrogenase/Fe-S oxidoreductase
MPLPREASRELESLFGDRYSESLLERLSHSSDMGFVPELVVAGLDINIVPDAVVYPKTVEEVVELVKIATKYKIPLVPYGRGTNRYGNAIPTEGGITVDFSMMRQITIARDQSVAMVQPGATWKEIDVEADPYKLSLRTFPSSYDSSVGGGIAGDALGIGSYEWGFISDNLTYVKFVNPRGEIETVSGPELAKVAGAEGTTGLIVEAGIKLRPKTPTLSFVFHSPSLDEVLKIIGEFYDTGLPLWHVQIRGPSISNDMIDGFKADLQRDEWNVIVMFPATREALIRRRLESILKNYNKELRPLKWVGWWTFNHAAIAALRRTGTPIHQHGLVPMEKLPDLIKELESNLGPLGVLEENRGFDLDIALERRRVLLVNAFTISSLSLTDKKLIYDLAKNTLMMDAFVKVGGSLLSVGMFAHKYAKNRLDVTSKTFSELGVDRYDMISKYKKEMDPEELFNPGKLLPPEKRGKKVFEISDRQKLALTFRFGIGLAKSVTPGGPNDGYKTVRAFLETFTDYAFQCIDCAMCVTVCPQYKVVYKNPYAPKGMFDFVKGAMAYYFLNDKKIDIPLSVIADISGCHKCGLCDRVCPENIPISYLLVQLSTKVAKGVSTKAYVSLGLTEKEPFSAIHNPDSTTVLWVGSLMQENVEEAYVAASILEKLKVKVRVIDTDKDSGFYEYISGSREFVERRLGEVIETLKDSELVITLTPEDYRTLNDYVKQAANIVLRKQLNYYVMPIELFLLSMALPFEGKEEEINLHVPCFATDYAQEIIAKLTSRGFKVKRIDGCSGAALAKNLGNRARELSKAMAEKYSELVTLCPLAAQQFRSFGIRAQTLVEFMASKLGAQKVVKVETKVGFTLSEDRKHAIEEIVMKSILEELENKVPIFADLAAFVSDSLDESRKILDPVISEVVTSAGDKIASELSKLVQEDTGKGETSVLLVTSSYVKELMNVVNAQTDFQRIASEVAEKVLNTVPDRSAFNKDLFIQVVIVSLRDKMPELINLVSRKLK